MFPLLFLLPLSINGQFLFDPSRLREILGVDSPPAPVFRNPNTFMMQQEQQEDQLLQLQKRPEEEAIVGDGIRFSPMASIRITPSKQETPTVEESLDLVAPHEWSKMTVFVKTGSDGRVGKSPLYSTLNDRFADVLSTWIRTTKGRMGGRIFTTTMSPLEATSTINLMPTSTNPLPPPPSFDDSSPLSSPQLPISSTPPPTEFIDKEELYSTKPPKTEVFDPRMPTVVEGWPLGSEVIEKNPLVEEDNDPYSPPQTFEDMLKICPMYPETATMFVHQMVRREYSVGFETRVQCRCGDGSHESFFARKSKPMLTDQGASLDPSFQRSDLIVGRFSCAFPGNICIKTENGIRLRSMDWQAHVYPAVGSGGGWANSYILLMENGTKLEDADTGKVYLGTSQFDRDRRKSRLEHSYLRIKSISCDACLHSLTCQR